MIDAIHDFFYFERKNETIVVLTSCGNHMQIVRDMINEKIKLPHPYVFDFDRSNRCFSVKLGDFELKILIRCIDNVQDLLGLQLDLIIVSGFGYTAIQTDKLNQFIRQGRRGNKHVKVKFYNEILF